MRLSRVRFPPAPLRSTEPGAASELGRLWPNSHHPPQTKTPKHAKADTVHTPRSTAHLCPEGPSFRIARAKFKLRADTAWRRNVPGDVTPAGQRRACADLGAWRVGVAKGACANSGARHVGGADARLRSSLERGRRTCGRKLGGLPLNFFFFICSLSHIR